ncbi:MAG: hypothetical protein JWN76_3066 [Chitinophagaceae bacterium]|nr:hypothetical protein [Chitinophagaceae bacterium]
MKFYKIKHAAVVSLFFASLTGCLKDKDFENGAIQSVHAGSTNQNIVEIKLSAGSSSNFLSISLNASSKDTILDLIPVNLSSKDPAPEDIHVTLVKNDKLVDDYNNANGTFYVVPASNTFQVQDGGVVTIPKGSHTGYLKIKFKPSDFIGNDYALGYAISSIDKAGYTISGNLNTGIVAISIKNKYDGHYRVTGTMVDLSNPAFTGRYPMDVYLITQDATSVAMFDLNPSINTYGHSFSNAGGLSFYGSFTPQIYFDANDNVSKVINAYGQPASNGRSASLDPSGINKFNNATHNIDVNYFMLQPSVVTPYRTSFKEHFEYLGPR